MGKVYIVCAPPEKRRIYDTWAECKEAVAGVPGARYQAVSSREKAQAMLDGPGVVLPPGTYAFTDGNAAGGVGVVFVEAELDGSQSVERQSMLVRGIFDDGTVPGFQSPDEVAVTLRQRRNILAEMAGLYYVLRRVPAGSELTVVHDFRGVSEWMCGSWRKEGGPAIAALVEVCRRLVQDRDLRITYRHQPGHQSTWCGRDDFAHWNAEADVLARQAVESR